MHLRRGIAVPLALSLCLALSPAATAWAGPPPGFTTETLLTEMGLPMSVGFLPDGRILVLKQ
ncbi:MAG: hypothetical protein ACREKH_04285, partial [Candidatus Rokuibacteriota bacterium]